MSKIQLIFFCVLSLKLSGSMASIWIKNVKSYGPTAANIGLKCLSFVSQLYLNDTTLTRSRTLVIAHTRNLSTPAFNIQKLYLKWVHEAVINGEMDELEIVLLSNADNAPKVSSKTYVTSNTIFEKDYYVLIMDNFAKFNQLMRSYVTQASFNPGAKFVILYINPNVQPTKKAQKELAFKLFRIMYNGYNAANVVFLYAVDADNYNIYVTTPFRNRTHCGSLEPVLLDTCQMGQLRRGAFTKLWLASPKVPKTLPNCTFKFCARVAEPYVNPGCETGLEIDVISVLQQKLQFKIKTICTKMQRGEPNGDGTWTGILGWLRDDKCDFVVGGFFPDYDVHDDFGVTAAYFHDEYTWYVYIAQRQPQWLAMLMIFEFYTWILIIVILAISALSWYFFGLVTAEVIAHKRVILCTLNSWSVFLGISANNRPHWNPLRIFFLTLAMYGLNLTTIYTSKLINVFTNPAYFDQIDTVEEIVESNLPIGGREEFSDWYRNDSLGLDEIISYRYNISDDFLPTVENLDAVADGKRVILTNRAFILSKSIHNVYPFSNNMFASPLEMVSEHGFPLLKRYSQMIMYMRDAGIIEKLYSDFLFNVTTLHHIRDIVDDEDVEEESQIVLTLSHMDGAFTLLILGNLLSFITFIVEVIVDTYKNRHARPLCRLLSKSRRQVSIMRSVQRQKNPRNISEMHDKWNATKRVRFNTSNDAVKPFRW